MSLFVGLEFLIVPSIGPPRVQFLGQLIEANGGILVETASKSTTVLFDDSYLDEGGNLKSIDLFHSEWEYADAVWIELISSNTLRFYKLSWISECLKQQKLVDIKELRASILADEESTISPRSEEGELRNGNPAVLSSEEETEFESQTSNASLHMSEKEDEAPIIKARMREPFEEPDEVPNAKLIKALESLSSKYRRQGDTYRSRGYQLALQSIQSYGKPIETEQEARSLPNIGSSIASKISMFIKLGTLPGLEISSNREDLLDYYMNCYGVGVHTARKWADAGMQTFKDCLTHFPSDFNWNVLFGWRYYEDWLERIPRKECEMHLNIIQNALESVDKGAEIILTGSYRRGAETCGDIDMVLYKPDCDSFQELSRILESTIIKLHDSGYILCPLNLNSSIAQAFTPKINEVTKVAGIESLSTPTPKEVLHRFYFGGRLPSDVAAPPTITATGDYSLKEPDQFMSGSQKAHRCRRVDILLCRWSQLGATMIYFTGNDDFNKSLRLRATNKGWKLSNNGLYQPSSNGTNDAKDTLIESFDEKRIMQLLGVTWVPPEERNIVGYI